MTNPEPTDQELAEERKREQAALFDLSAPLQARIEDFRKSLRESQRGATGTKTTQQSLQESL